jgi:uncharacterized protein involved in exopolysaccharide biosynthesis
MAEDLTPRFALHVVFRHKKKVLCLALLVTGCAVALTALIQPRYRSEAMLFVRLGRENVALDPTASMGGGSVVAIPQAREDEINSLVEILKSRVLAERIVDEFGPEKILGKTAERQPATTALSPVNQWLEDHLGSLEPYWDRLAPGPPASPREEALEKFARLLNVWAPRRSTVVYVSYDAPSAETAQQIVTRMLDLYMEEHVRLNRTAGSHDFFVEQSQQSRQRLTAAEEQLRDLKNRTGMASVADQRTILVERVGRLEDGLLASNTELTSLEAEIAALNEKLDRLPETRVTQRVSGLPNQAADLMRQQLYGLQLKEQELLSKFKEETREVKEIRRQVQEAQAILAKEEYDRTQSTNSADPTFAQLHLNLHSKQTVLASLRARVERSREQLVQARAALELLNDHEMKLVQLQREVELEEANYRKYADNLEQARIDQALKLERISNIGVAQPATYEPRQVRPNTRLQIALGVLVGVLSGVLLAFAAEYYDRSIKTTRDIELQLELCPLVAIPRLPDRLVKPSTMRVSHAHALPR